MLALGTACMTGRPRRASLRAARTDTRRPCPARCWRTWSGGPGRECWTSISPEHERDKRPRKQFFRFSRQPMAPGCQLLESATSVDRRFFAALKQNEALDYISLSAFGPRAQSARCPVKLVTKRSAQYEKTLSHTDFSGRRTT
jgi:hypothetical protein